MEFNLVFYDGTAITGHGTLTIDTTIALADYLRGCNKHALVVFEDGPCIIHCDTAAQAMMVFASLLDSGG